MWIIIFFVKNRNKTLFWLRSNLMIKTNTHKTIKTKKQRKLTPKHLHRTKHAPDTQNTCLWRPDAWHQMLDLAKLFTIHVCPGMHASSNWPPACGNLVGATCLGGAVLRARNQLGLVGLVCSCTGPRQWFVCPANLEISVRKIHTVWREVTQKNIGCQFGPPARHHLVLYAKDSSASYHPGV